MNKITFSSLVLLNECNDISECELELRRCFARGGNTPDCLDTAIKIFNLSC